MKVEVVWNDPQIVVFQDLLYSHECDKITDNLAAKLKIWSSVDKYEGGSWTDVRVMKK